MWKSFKRKLKGKEGDENILDYLDIVEKDLEESKKRENEFEKKKSMKYLYNIFSSSNYKDKFGKNTKIDLKIDIYSDKKLTKMELKNQGKSTNEQILILIEYILSAEIGQVVLKKEVRILPTINLDKKEYSKKDLDNLKPKKNLIVVITKC